MGSIYRLNMVSGPMIGLPGLWSKLLAAFALAFTLASASALASASLSADVEPAASEGGRVPPEKGRFAPLVTHVDGVFDVNPVFEAQLEHILEANRISYAVARDYLLWRKNYQDPDSDLFTPLNREHGWDVSVLDGKTGGYFGDKPGILALHREDGVLIIALHGSILPADWLTNLDCRKVDSQDVALGGCGKLHRGFAVKVSQFQTMLRQQISDLFAALSEEERERLLIFVTGHSHGAALAQLTGPVVVKVLRQIWKEDFNNQRENKVQIYRLAAPRSIGDEAAYEDINEVVGRHNNIRQNMNWDWVPSVIPGEDATAALGSFRFKWSQQVFGHRSGGFLALQKSGPIARANLQAHSGQLGVTQVKAWTSFLINCFVNPHFVSGLKSRFSFAFDPSLVDRDTRQLLANGYEHIQKKRQQANDSCARRLFSGVCSLIAE